MLCIPTIPSSGFPSNVTLLLPGRLLNPGAISLPHVADFNGIRRGWDLRDTQAPPTNWEGKGFHVLKRQSDGSWKFVVMILNP
jgi:hypothetical protein